jgi:hypothetical protein
MADAAPIRVTMLNLDPAPWRAFDVSPSVTLAALHDIIQAAFLWQDSHLWQFEIGDRIYGPEAENFPGMRIYKAGNMKLSQVRDAGFVDFLYTYDMGDNWEHRVQLLETRSTDADLPRFCAGEWRSPPEDIGGFPGFELFLAAIADPGHPEHAELIDWHGGPFDRTDIGEAEIRARMARLAKGRGRRR